MTDTVKPFVKESAEAFRKARATEAVLPPRRDDGALLEFARLIDGAERAIRQTAPSAFAAGYSSLSQTVRMDWNFGGEDEKPIVHLRHIPPSRMPIDLSLVRFVSDPLTCRSLPGAPPFSAVGDTFDVGSRFNINWPDRSNDRPGIATQRIKMAASAGMIAAAIAGFWGGSVIKSGHTEAMATSLTDTRETSATPPVNSRAIRVVSTDATPQAGGSPFGSVPAAFPTTAQNAMGRPLPIAAVKPESSANLAASDGATLVVPKTVAAPSPTPEAAQSTAANPASVTTADTRTDDATTIMSAKSSSRGSAHAVHQTEIARHAESLSPSKKRNPLVIVRFGDPTGPVAHPPGGALQSQSVVAQRSGGDFFLTRFLDKIFRN